jgi:hypothetical protein
MVALARLAHDPCWGPLVRAGFEPPGWAAAALHQPWLRWSGEGEGCAPPRPPPRWAAALPGALRAVDEHHYVESFELPDENNGLVLPTIYPGVLFDPRDL